jgi:hypothetical protein
LVAPVLVALKLVDWALAVLEWVDSALAASRLVVLELAS